MVWYSTSFNNQFEVFWFIACTSDSLRNSVGTYYGRRRFPQHAVHSCGQAPRNGLTGAPGCDSMEALQASTHGDCQSMAIHRSLSCGSDHSAGLLINFTHVRNSNLGQPPHVGCAGSRSAKAARLRYTSHSKAARMD